MGQRPDVFPPGGGPLRIYTRAGDGGETGLWGGRRARKDDPRVEACGAVDELNAAVGWARALDPGAEVDAVLEAVQRDLLQVGADLADPGGRDGAAPRLGPDRVRALEEAIDRLDARLPRLDRFILPGGSPAGAALHVARTVGRRAERRVVALAGREAVNPQVIAYLNRLSDLLFVLARTANRAAGIPETTWEAERR
jgi:cob(I)alamin adenosyltransferase